jgi:hypothetical protein
VRPSADDVRWLAATLDRESRRTGALIRVSEGGLLVADW